MPTSTSGAVTRPRLALLVAAWLVVYGALVALDHATLRSNAFDLSVFDYALWSTTHGPRPGYVPFYGQTLNSHHFMPTLWTLWPLHLAVPSPWLLIAVQLLAMAAAGWQLAKVSAARLPRLAAFAIVAAFLFSRRAHGVITSVFYIECLEPVLIFGAIASIAARRWIPYWICVVLALGCKEDMPIYIASLGLLLALDGSTRRIGIATIGLSIVWMAFAIKVFVPWARALDGFAPDYAFVVDRYGESPLWDSLARLARWETMRRLASLTLMAGFMCWVRPRWLLVAMPAIVLNLAAKDEALQSGLIGHYLWPILPFLFLSAVEGAAYAHARWPRALRVWAVVLLIAIVADNPIFRPSYLASRLADWEAAAEIRLALGALPENAAVLAQPQLIPHIAKRHDIEAIGRQLRTPIEYPDVIVLSRLGSQWPLTDSDFDRIVSGFDLDPRYVRSPAAPPALAMFTRREDRASEAPPETKRHPAPR